MIVVARGIALDEGEIVETFVRSPGPGGQKVNKTATAVELRLDVAHSPSLPPWLKERLAAVAGRRLAPSGHLVISAHRFRTRERNRKDALERLVALLRRAAEVPERRIPTRPSAAAKERRLEEKRRLSQLKQTRREEPEG
ncbi:MAG: alternative ribosome rescue aminoacyl-tRNA hydrolase ArfB [Acidobacteriota bacterium]